MSVFDAWSEFITNILTSESDLASCIVQHYGELGDAREALIQGVLQRILPSIYEIGRGEIVDHLGKHSKQIDIVIARRDFPALVLPSGSKVYLIESVLATVEVKSELNSHTLSEALENCASVSDLSPNVVEGALQKLAHERGLIEIAPGTYTHDNPLETARFDLLARPPGYTFSFSGYKVSAKEMCATISHWAEQRNKQGDLAMRHFPAVIAAEGCVAWRNDVPYSTASNLICLVGKEKTPLRLLILHLLYTLSRKIPTVPDIHGIRPNLDVYLEQMRPPPPFECTVGSTTNREITG